MWMLDYFCVIWLHRNTNMILLTLLRGIYDWVLWKITLIKKKNEDNDTLDLKC